MKPKKPDNYSRYFPQHKGSTHPGIVIREYMATHIMAALSTTSLTIEEAAKEAVARADALMAAFGDGT